MSRKYTYYRVLQSNYGFGWEDEDFHETDSTYHPLNYKGFKENVKAYRENSPAPIRIINRRELNQ